MPDIRFRDKNVQSFLALEFFSVKSRSKLYCQGIYFSILLNKILHNKNQILQINHIQMVRERLRFLPLINMAGDALLLTFSFIAAYYSIWHHFKPNAEIFLIKVAVALLLCWGVTAFTIRLYSHEQYDPYGKLLLKHFLTLLVSAILLALMVYFMNDFVVARIIFIYGYFLFAVLDTFFRVCVLFMIRRR